MKVIIVEEEEAVRRTFAFLAQRDGWEAFTADQQADCAGLIREHEIDIMVVDYDMPFATGLDLIAQLRQEGISIPAILVSVDEYEIDRNRATRLGVVEILALPPDVQEFRRALKAALPRGARL